MDTALDKKPLIMDCGAKYGINPSHKELEQCCNFALIEADPYECEILKRKYNDRAADISIFHAALGRAGGTIEFSITSHPGSCTAKSIDINNQFWQKLRKGSNEILEMIRLNTVSLDAFCNDNNLKPDILKVDVAGSEIELFEGASEILKGVVGLKTSTTFNSLWSDQPPTCARISDILTKNGFIFLNHEQPFSNSYIPFSEYYLPGRHGMLVALDAVYINSRVLTDNMSISELVCAALFMMTHGATDIAIDLLLKSGHTPFTVEVYSRDEHKLLETLERLVAKLFFSMRDMNKFSLEEFHQPFYNIFGKNWVKPGEYFRRYPI